jgi:hypothetical protein
MSAPVDVLNRRKNLDKAFWLSGAYAPFIWNAFTLKLSKVSKGKCCVYIFTSAHEAVPRKKWLFNYAAHLIMMKFGVIINLFERLFLSFCTGHGKCHFHENLCEHIRCENIAANTFPNLLNILKFVCSKVSICWPGSKVHFQIKLIIKNYFVHR